MPLYAVIGLDHPPHSMALRDRWRAEHRSYFLGNDRPIKLAGAMYDSDENQCGTLAIFEADSIDEVWDWYRREPFYTNGVYKNIHIVEWRLALNALEPTGGWVKN
jgi:uncharacterized protein YciI